MNPFYNLTESLIEPFNKHVHEMWVKPNDINVFKQTFFSRSVYLVLTPASLITTAINTIVGLGSSLGVFLTLGTHVPALKFTSCHLQNSKNLISTPYSLFLRAVNPDAKFPTLEKSPYITFEGNGFVTEVIKDSLLIRRALDLSKTSLSSESRFKRTVTTRLPYILVGVACLIARTIDGIIGVPAAAFSILTAGKFGSLNNLAYKSLLAPAVIGDIFVCTVICINPSAQIER